MKRRKQAALLVPKELAEAQQIAADYVDCDRRTLACKLYYECEIDKLKAERDRIVGEIGEYQKPLFAQLKSWWEAGGKDMAGKHRSAELGGAKIGLRLSTPAVKFGKGWNAAKVLTWLQGLRWSRKSEFLRTTVALDKQAMIKAMAEPEVARTLRTVIEVVQIDEFFIDTRIDEAAVRASLDHASPDGEG